MEDVCCFNEISPKPSTNLDTKLNVDFLINAKHLYLYNTLSIEMLKGYIECWFLFNGPQTANLLSLLIPFICKVEIERLPYLFVHPKGTKLFPICILSQNFVAFTMWPQINYYYCYYYKKMKCSMHACTLYLLQVNWICLLKCTIPKCQKESISIIITWEMGNGNEVSFAN